MRNNLEKKYEEFKNIIDILPVNTKQNKKKKLDYILEEETKDNNLLDSIKDEINKRLSKFDKLKENPNIKKLEAELEKCNIINEWNSYNTAYEKMHLDYYLYQLHRYYKEDLSSLNSCIKMIIEAFKKVGIQLTKEDFDMNNYVSLYMEKVLSNASNEELNTAFEDIYWKFPEIIKTLEINFKNIYFKNEKKINKYYDDRHAEYLKNHKDSEIIDMRIKIYKEINNIISRDEYLIFNKFKNKEYSLADYNLNDISKKKELYFNDNNYTYDNLEKVYSTLFEYNLLLKYNYLLMDMRDKLDKKDTLKNAKGNALKEIMKEEGKLKKLNAKQNSKSLPFMKKKIDEKWLFDYKTVLGNIISKYDEFDAACFNDLVFNKLSKDSSVLEVFKVISSNYLYFVEKTKSLEDGSTISQISDKFEELKSDINNNQFTLINNLALLDEKQMKEIIADKYNLEGVKLTIDALQKDNVEKTMKDIKMLMDYEDVIASGINLDDIKLYLEWEKLTEEK